VVAADGHQMRSGVQQCVGSRSIWATAVSMSKGVQAMSPASTTWTAEKGETSSSGW